MAEALVDVLMETQITPAQAAWADGVVCPVPAPTVAAVVLQLYRDKGVVTPETLLESARARRSPLHRCFEWNDADAAEKYRRSQAQHLLMGLVITPEAGQSHQGPMRLMLSAGWRKGYAPSDAVMSHDELRGLTLARAMREAELWQARYGRFQEFAGVVMAMKEASAQVKGSRHRRR